MAPALPNGKLEAGKLDPNEITTVYETTMPFDRESNSEIPRYFASFGFPWPGVHRLSAYHGQKPI
jgi:hypothetical protein